MKVGTLCSWRFIAPAWHWTMLCCLHDSDRLLWPLIFNCSFYRTCHTFPMHAYILNLDNTHSVEIIYRLLILLCCFLSTKLFRAKKFYPSSCVCRLSDKDKRFQQNEWLRALLLSREATKHAPFLLSLCLYARLLISATMIVLWMETFPLAAQKGIT